MDKPIHKTPLHYVGHENGIDVEIIINGLVSVKKSHSPMVVKMNMVAL